MYTIDSAIVWAISSIIDQTLKDEFVVRVKLSRNSNQTKMDEKSKKKAVKLIDAKI